MGKYIIQYAVPAIMLLGIAWLILKFWFLYLFGGHVRSAKKIKKASKKYDREL